MTKGKNKFSNVLKHHSKMQTALLAVWNFVTLVQNNVMKLHQLIGDSFQHCHEIPGRNSQTVTTHHVLYYLISF